ncbi:unnamed protein product [Rotaria sordida]|uniref:Uncharacterized protein n=1 Tax=Rotaria sordida TaxID=392033 RepID=A0A818GA50_9BILA|nr:unnamed protein product [Rotaria sordida]CAF0960159.1 unnamed protein product [Rotaria sordida]CAF0999858.1 unnamed protein product [Rotaria sordida]CAF1005477.1 unnamed protein product [Rotaria sordida]CAF1165469.1 unnamed protein product [Rotaria sordida]
MSKYDLYGDPNKAGPQPKFKPQEQDSPGYEYKMDPIPDYGVDSYKGSGKLLDKIAVITGGDSGIGRAVALAYAREGATIIISYLNEHEDAAEIQKAVEKSGRECILVPGDISQEAQCKTLIDTAVAKFKRIDILVNNAAYQGKQVEDIAELDHQRVEYTFKTNIISMFDLVRYAVPHMPKGGAIINVGSIQAYDPSAEILDYATTKAAIVGFTKGLASKLLEKGIRVNCVAPGPVWTPLVVASFPKEKNSQFGSTYPIKRPAQPRELAPAFVFLACGADSSYISGEILSVTGGKPTA